MGGGGREMRAESVIEMTQVYHKGLIASLASHFSVHEYLWGYFVGGRMNSRLTFCFSPF